MLSSEAAGGSFTASTLLNEARLLRIRWYIRNRESSHCGLSQWKCLSGIARFSLVTHASQSWRYSGCGARSWILLVSSRSRKRKKRKSGWELCCVCRWRLGNVVVILGWLGMSRFSLTRLLRLHRRIVYSHERVLDTHITSIWLINLLRISRSPVSHAISVSSYITSRKHKTALW